MMQPAACRLFGLDVLTHVPPHCVHRGTGETELEILPDERLVADAGALGPPALSVPLRHPDGAGPYELWVRGEALLLSVPAVGRFVCEPRRLGYRCLPDVADEALQWQVFGMVMSAWLEWAGRTVLHGATVDVAGSAIAFLGRSGAGKSSVTLEFLQHGHRVFGDDHVVLDHAAGVPQAQPSLPWLKVGRDLASRVGVDYACLPLIHSGAPKRCLAMREHQWADGPRPLGPLYVLDRREHLTEITFERLEPAQSLVALVRHTFVPRTVHAAGLVPGRLPRLAAVAQRAGVWRLRYPNGLEWLGRVREAVTRHACEQISESPVPSPQ